ncbi:AIR synthase-related protein, partial [Acinetobacter baumannii]
VDADIDIHPSRVRAGDAVIVSGDLGRHGMAIMACREGLQFEPAIESDCAALVEPVLALLAAGLRPHCLRDVTRGGLAAVLNELASASG